MLGAMSQTISFGVSVIRYGTNGAGRSYVAYLFADNPDGGIKCGEFTFSGRRYCFRCRFQVWLGFCLKTPLLQAIGLS